MRGERDHLASSGCHLLPPHHGLSMTRRSAQHSPGQPRPGRARQGQSSGVQTTLELRDGTELLSSALI